MLRAGAWFCAAYSLTNCRNEPLYQWDTDQWRVAVYGDRSTGTIDSTIYFYERGSCPAGYTKTNNSCVQSGSAGYEPVTDSDLDTITAEITSPSDAAALAPEIVDIVPGSFDYPDSETFGGPNSIELPTVETTTLDNVGNTTVTQEMPTLNFEYSTNPLSITTTTTTVTNTYQNGTLTSTTTNTTTGPATDAPVSETPTDCDFMPTVCAWLAWFKEPIAMPEPEFEEIRDEDFEKSYSANFGGSCPSPRTIQLSLFPPVQFSWAPLCEFAGYLKFLVVGGAALMAAFIGLGISRGNA